MKNFKFNLCMLLLFGAIGNIGAHYCHGLLDPFTCNNSSFNICKWVERTHTVGRNCVPK